MYNFKVKSLFIRTKIVQIFILAIISFCTISCTKASDNNTLVSNVAHRGGADLAPENSLAAFENAIENNVDMVELDLHLSKDGTIMVLHDPTLVRLTNQEGSVSDFTEEELSQLDCAINFKKGKHEFGFQKIPTLDEVISFIEEKSQHPIKYQIEIKVKEDKTRYDKIEQQLIEILEKHSITDRTVVISFYFDILKEIKQINPNLQLGALVSKSFFSSFPSSSSQKIAKYIKNLDVDYVGINYKYLTQELYDEFRANGLKVGVWTVNTRHKMKKFISMGVDFITTNRPDLLNKKLSK